MNPLETRLAGNPAALKGITDFIRSHRGCTPLKRVELRYSTQSATPLDVTLAKKMIGDLLRKHGMNQTEVSVRPHEGALDHATGEHLLRLFAVEREEQQLQRNGLWSWLARLFSQWFEPLPAARTQADVPPAPVITPRLSGAQAVDYLRRAVNQAAIHLGDETRVTMGTTIAMARVVVRLKDVHDVLGPMVLGNLDLAAVSIGVMVRAQKLPLAPAFKVSYDYKPRYETEGTIYAHEADVEVVLLLNAAQRLEPQRVDPNATAMPAVTSPQPYPYQPTTNHHETYCTHHLDSLPSWRGQPCPG